MVYILMLGYGEELFINLEEVKFIHITRVEGYNDSTYVYNLKIVLSSGEINLKFTHSYLVNVKRFSAAYYKYMNRNLDVNSILGIYTKEKDSNREELEEDEED